MPNLTLHHIQYTQLDSMAWCATADVSSTLQPIIPKNLTSKLLPLTAYPDFDSFCYLIWQYHNNQTLLSATDKAHHKRQQQRVGVRLLLQELLVKLDITDTLDESKFPYQLVNSQYYVCFSHTDNRHVKDNFLGSTSKVAVIISRHRAVGVDIETQNIAWQLAQRFYHPNEISTLATLPVEQRTVISKTLWQIKESFIKIHQYKLAQGLGMNYAALISDLTLLISSSESEHCLLTVTKDNDKAEDKKMDYKSEYKIVFLSLQQTIVIF